MGFGEFLEHILPGEPEERRPMTDQTEDESSTASSLPLQPQCAAQDGDVAPKPVRRHRSRNVQLSLKVSAGVKEQFTAVAAAHGLAFGELLERALDTFVREAKRW